jgi:predicted RNA-binding protein
VGYEKDNRSGRVFDSPSGRTFSIGGPRSEENTMCEANAYFFKNGKEELILEAVDVLENEGDEVRIANIFGEQKTVRGRIRKMSLVDHKILIEE